MLVFVINLLESKDRLEFQLNQLKHLGLEFRVIEAVGKSELTEDFYLKYSRTWQRLMRATEVACFMSHKKAWENVILHNGPCLILEDDALLSNCVPRILKDLVSSSECDLVTLENRGRKKIVGKTKFKLSCDSHLLELYQDRTGAAGYVLWPEGAKKLINKFKQQKIGLADAFISSCYELKAYQVEPSAIIQLDQCEHYSVTCEKKTQSTIIPSFISHPKSKQRITRMMFKLRRFWGQVLMAIRHLSVLKKSERRKILLRKKDFVRD